LVVLGKQTASEQVAAANENASRREGVEMDFATNPTQIGQDFRASDRKRSLPAHSEGIVGRPAMAGQAKTYPDAKFHKCVNIITK
jgi:hypothetical protein